MVLAVDGGMAVIDKVMDDEMVVIDDMIVIDD